MGVTPTLPVYTGTVLADRYEVGAIVEGTREVYGGTDLRGGTPVTIFFRFVEGDAAALARLQALSDPRIARVLAAGAGAARYLVTESLDGYSVNDELRGGPLSLGRVLEIGARICEAVGVLHAHDLVHGALGTNAVYVGWPSGATDDARDVKLVPPSFARPATPELIAADVAACRALIDAMLGPESTAPPAMRRELAHPTIATAAQLAQRCRALLHELPEAQRTAVGKRPFRPEIPDFAMPRPTNWTPPPKPRTFQYNARPKRAPEPTTETTTETTIEPAPETPRVAPPPAAIVVDRQRQRNSLLIAVGVALLVVIALVIWWLA